jgi:hypothetical protein
LAEQEIIGIYRTRDRVREIRFNADRTASSSIYHSTTRATWDLSEYKRNGDVCLHYLAGDTRSGICVGVERWQNSIRLIQDWDSGLIYFKTESKE